MTNSSQKETAIALLKAAAAGKVDEAFERYVGPGFIHHNPFFRGDADSLKQAMRQNAVENPGKILEIKQVLQDGDRVVILSHIRQHTGDRGAAVVHIFRFSAGRVVEVWDIGQPIPEDSPNQNGMF